MDTTLTKASITDIDIKICYRCNLSCLHCAVSGKSRSHMISSRKIFNEIDYFKEISTDRIILTGGEPTLHPEIIQIVKYANQAGFRDIHLQTNAILLSEKTFVQKLKDSGLTSALVSLHGHTSSIHDNIVRKAGTFKKTVSGIHNLESYNILVSTNTVIRKENINYLSEYIVFISAEFNNIKTVNFSYPRITGGTKRNFNEIIMRYSEIAPHLLSAFNVAESKEIWCWISDFPLCLLPSHEHHNSDVITRTAAGFDPSKSERVKNYQLFLQTQKIKTDKCLNCYLSPICLGIDIQYYTVFGDNELLPYGKS